MAESCVERELWRVWFSLWWNHITSFRFCCWDALKSLQYSTSEESHSWALNTLVCGLYCLDGKMGNFFFLPWVLQCCFKDMGIFLSALWDTKPLFFFPLHMMQSLSNIWTFKRYVLYLLLQSMGRIRTESTSSAADVDCGDSSYTASPNRVLNNIHGLWSFLSKR